MARGVNLIKKSKRTKLLNRQENDDITLNRQNEKGFKRKEQKQED